MLNELVSIERGVTLARIGTNHRHPDVRVAGKKRTLKVQLDEKGRVTAVVLVPGALSPWTLRDGQHNSFPLVQLKKPLWGTPLTDLQREMVADKKNRRQALHQLAGIAHLDAAAYANWPGKKMITRLRERREQLVPLQDGVASVVLATFDRFLRAFDSTAGGDALRTIESVARRITEDIERIAQDDYLECAVALLVGEKKT